MKDLSTVKGDLEDVANFFKKDLKNIRTGRANANLFDDLSVNYYGVPTPLSQMATISVPDACSLVITPWGKDSLVDIEKSINESDLNVNPVNDGNVVRLNFPPLTEEKRKELVKILGKKVEEARIAVRKVREEVWSNIQKEEKDGVISEDDKFAQKDKLQKYIDEYNKKIEEIGKKKETELMTV